mgnify:CR=1 FL=1
MYKLTFILPFLLLLAVACGPAANKEEQQTETEVELESDPAGELLTADLGSVAAIENWVADIALKVNDKAYPAEGPTKIARGDNELDVTIFNRQGKINVIRVEDPDAKMLSGQRYYLRNGQVVMLEEKGVREDGTHMANRFYYHAGEVLKAETRRAETEDGLATSAPQPYESPYGDMDYRLKPKEVKASAQRYLKGR